MVLRWIHFVAGITWVGLLYFFNLVGVPLVQELDAKTRGIVVPKLMRRALWWFRWSALVTVLAGIAYWMHIVASDVRNAVSAGEPASAGMMFGAFFGLWTLAFVIEMGALMSPAEVLRKGPVLGVIVGIALVAVAYIFLSLNQHGWESNRALAIGIGGGLGWFMLLNVWGVVWRMQKKTDPLDRSQCQPGNGDAARGAQGGENRDAVYAPELLGVVPHAVLHGRGQPLHSVCGR